MSRKDKPALEQVSITLCCWKIHDHEYIRGPRPLVIDRVVAFIDRNTRHLMKVVGLNMVRVGEYPVEALREALVNAVPTGSTRMPGERSIFR